MSLIDRQIKKRLGIITSRYLKQGRLPPANFLGTELAKFSRKIDGGPTFTPQLQTPYRRFDVNAWNNMMSDVEFDLSVLYEELVSHTILLMRRTGWSEASYRSQRIQLAKILAALDDILFVAQNGEDHFLGVSDPITDMSNVDIDNSTSRIVDLVEGAAVLPPGALSTKRVKMSHLARMPSRKVTVLQPELASISKSTTAADAPFSNLFSDLALMWRHDVVTTSKGPVEIEVTFPITEDDTPVKVTRLSIVSSSESKMTMDALYTLDNFNYLQFPGGSLGIELDNSMHTRNLDFAASHIRGIRLRIKKELPDEVTDAGNRFSFGLRSIALYTLGRAIEATYQSIPLTPEGSSIEAVSLDVNEYVPAGTSIDYFIASSTGEFHPISPIGRSSSTTPKTVRFGRTEEKREFFVASSPVLEETVRAVPLYSINTTALTGEPIFGTAKLYRGKDSWARNDKSEDITEFAKDTWIDFSSSNAQKIYTSRTDGIAGQVVNGVTQIQAPIDIYYNPLGGHLLTPPAGIDPTIDTQPRYAISKILVQRNLFSFTGEQLLLNGLVMGEFVYRNLDSSVRPLVSDTGGLVTYTEDQDYILEKSFKGATEVLTGRIQRLQGSTITSGQTVSLDYTVSRNVTDWVSEIKYNNTIVMSIPITGDLFRSTYRYIPVGQIVAGSVVATEKFGDSTPGVLFKEGSDYTIDTATGTIIRMDGGTIKNSTYVDFRFNTSVISSTTYSTWVFVDKVEPVKIQFSKLLLDVLEGEKFSLDVSGGQVDLTEAAETPALSQGWHRFIVVSSSEALSSALGKVLSLQDLEGNYVFVGNEYFSEITAFRASMVQVTEQGLKYNTRKIDHSNFAITEAKKVLTNFQPGQTTDITTLYYNTIGASLATADEKFEVAYRIASGDTPTSVRVKAVLTRNSTTDPGITPKLFDYSVRIRR